MSDPLRALAVLEAIARQQHPDACRRCGRQRSTHHGPLRDAADWRFRSSHRYRPRRRLRLILWRNP